MVFSEVLHKSNIRIQKRKYKYSYLKKRVKRATSIKEDYMFLIRRLKTKKSEMFLMPSGHNGCVGAVAAAN